jgi:hypothetical protein
VIRAPLAVAAALAVLAASVATALSGVGCTTGTTPDCSGEAGVCGYVAPEGGGGGDGATDATLDAASDAPLDTTLAPQDASGG